MPNYEVRYINNLTEIEEDIRAKKSVWGEPFWFRGVKNAMYPLIPGLYRRHIRQKTLVDYEEQTLNLFITRNYARLAGERTGNVPDIHNISSWLCWMQHYGISTRLLDWSENCLKAMAFALEGYLKRKPEESRTLPCVWLLRPMMLNRFRANEPTKIPNMERLCETIEWENMMITNCLEKTVLPIAVYPANSNSRILSQEGVFTLFPLPDCKNCVHNVTCEGQYSVTLALDNSLALGIEGMLTKYIFLDPYPLAESIKALGMKLSSLYPALNYVSDEIEKEIEERRLY